MTRGERRNDDETMLYTDTFKARMVRRMLGPKAMSANALADEVGIAQPTPSRWLRETSTFRAMAKKDKDEPPPADTGAGKRPQDWTAGERLRAVAETLALDGEALGEYLRRNGIHSEQLEQWRADAQAALELPRRRRPAAETKRIKELERELRRKDKALAEAAALLVLRKKSKLSGKTRTTTRTGAKSRDGPRCEGSGVGGSPPGERLQGDRHRRAHGAAVDGRRRQRGPAPRTDDVASERAYKGGGGRHHRSA